jgi:type II secretory pathway component PulF
MIYPAVVTGVGVLVTLLLLTVVVPQIGTALAGQGLELPTVTRVLVAVGTGLKENIPLAAGVVGVAAVVLVALRGPILKAAWSVVRRLPRMRELVSAQEQARFFAVMAAMTRSGVPLADALGTGAGAVTDAAMRRQIVSLRPRLVEGGALRTLIESVTTFPAPTRRLLVAAERAGDVQSAFDALATDTADEVDRRAGRLLAVLEPLLIVLMFLVIGALMLAIMVPLIRLTSQAV